MGRATKKAGTREATGGSPALSESEESLITAILDQVVKRDLANPGQRMSASEQSKVPHASVERNTLVAALTACADDTVRSRARKFLSALSSDELQFLAEFV